MQFRDIIQRVCAKCDDPDQTYITPDYVMGFAQDTYEWLFGKLRLTGSQFDEETIILPAVPAGTPNLDSYMATGGVLAGLVQPRIIRWKLPGLDPTYWQRSDGPLDEVRDLTNAGEPMLDSWAYTRYSIKLSNFNVNLDLEITGEFLFDQLNSPDSQVEISAAYNRTFSCKLAAEVGKARGNDKWVTTYEADADDSLDDLRLAMVKARQGITERVARMSRNGFSGNLAITPQI